ncbi:hypothetical protein [Kitasatospora sp. NPDC088346]|uniref:hypothetical protein n=1 Tax=Kitasatospora sp. NPDC088346 TaxID=3364073 RepID=UPI003803B9F9
MSGLLVLHGFCCLACGAVSGMAADEVAAVRWRDEHLAVHREEPDEPAFVHMSRRRHGPPPCV